ncbi:phage replication protein [Streptomyces albofaciens JCM 4342]|uniref:poly-gamma-glutamate hydrolase family protein n=1 Tax=Streptomyces albofaciens TaxID=66866 RepID=UPI0012384CF0|nr:poly-gamma-glutamate hydrolase family protein [Streptomyces albofaciens]KAA6224390.1 phage replication protein [Streptomyces albofaciens JCM 4342]
MSPVNRRTVLTAALGAAAVSSTPLVTGLGAAKAHATSKGDKYKTNTLMYKDLSGQEGIQYARRYRRHELFDNERGGRPPYHRTTVMALHGGAIEKGTSELCLGIAGYHPGTLEPLFPGEPVYDYWMFEGLRLPSMNLGSNRELHVTAKNCDDHVAIAMATSSLNVLSLHGCKAEQAGVRSGQDPKVVVVGGLNAAFKKLLHEELGAAGFKTVDGDDFPDLAGVDPDNPCNRTVLRKGGQLELTTELRESFFGTDTLAGRADSTKPEFKAFAGACRKAIARLETGADQVIL